MAACNNPPPRNPYRFTDDETQITGFDMDLVTEPARRQSNYDFICAVCLGLARDPRDIGCRHVMCTACFRKLKEDDHNKTHCPQCRREIIFKNNRLNLQGQRDYNAHRVRCRFGTFECGFEGHPEEVDLHQEGCVNTPWIHRPCNHRVIPAEHEAHRLWHEWDHGMAESLFIPKLLFTIFQIDSLFYESTYFLFLWSSTTRS